MNQSPDSVMLSERRLRYIKARDNNTCQLRSRGCTIQADHIQLRYPEPQLRAAHRDPNSTDNWVSVCSYCSAQPTVNIP